MACKNITVRRKRVRQYLIHHLGGASFVVRVFGKMMRIYNSKYTPDITAGKKVYETTFKKIYVPSSLKPGEKVVVQNICDIGLAGNSLLVHIDGTRYIYIGHDVAEVEMSEPPIANGNGYYSELCQDFAGNKFLKVPMDVPLAYAITENYVYMFHTMKRYPLRIFPDLTNIIPPLNPATDYQLKQKNAMRITSKRIANTILVPFTTY